MKLTYDAPVFERLLKLNPWAVDLWGERLELIKTSSWNVNSLDRGGNPETRVWFENFFRKRSEATLARLQGLPNAPSTSGDLFKDDREVEEYCIGQFKADFLLLAQASLRGLTINEELDIATKIFPIGLDLVDTTLLGPLNAQGTIFGPFSDHSSCNFQFADFSRSLFLGRAHFTVSNFNGDVTFMNAHVQGPASFHATQFSGQALFNGCQFEHSADADLPRITLAERLQRALQRNIPSRSAQRRMVPQHQTSPSRHQCLAPPIQSNQAASCLEYAPACSRNVIRETPN